ncbi:MAG: IS1182 family transposase [Planctomycetaceae bacterium]
MNKPKNAAGLEVRVKSPRRRQMQMRMLCLNEMVRDDHPARAVWQYVQSLDLSLFYRDIQAVEGGVGRDAVDPRILLTLWLTATIEGISSARELAELCTRDFVYLWICGEVTVNRDLLNDFRSRHPVALDALLTETIGVLLHSELISLGRVAQDGMRVRASAGKSSFRRQETLEKHLAEARERVEQMRREADDDEEHGRRQSARERTARERLERIEQAIEERNKLQTQREQQSRNADKPARASTTDPEARVMQMADGGYRPAYNVQFATTCESRIIVGVDVTNQGSDSGLMQPMIEDIERNHQQRPREYLVDGGFSSRKDTTRLEQQNVQVYSPIKSAEKIADEGGDPYARRRGDSDEYYAFRQRMATDEAKQIYKERASTAEFPNAGCRNRGLQQFKLRGLKKVRILAVWQALAHNLIMLRHHRWLPTFNPTS